MRRRVRATPDRATDRELAVVAAVVVAGSEKAAAHRLGLSHSTVKHHLANARSKVGATTTAQLVWILAPRLPEAGSTSSTDEQRTPRRDRPLPARPARVVPLAPVVEALDPSGEDTLSEESADALHRRGGPERPIRATVSSAD
jgi:DNA-binding CsgD family transcriptional regulator